MRPISFERIFLLDICFKRPDLDNIEEYFSYYDKFSHNLLTCEGVPSTLVLWESFYNQQFAIYDDILFVKFETEKNNCFFLMPFGDVKRGIEVLIEYTNSLNIPLQLFCEEGERLEEFRKYFKDDFTITPLRDDLEYIYSAESLKTLSGKKLHSKRNHISAFDRNYKWNYEPLSTNNLDDALKMADLWAERCEDCSQKESLLSENAAMKRVLPFMNRLRIKGGVIRVEGKVVAFCFGAPINQRVFDVQVEKALPEYKGAYAVINREFVKSLDENYEYINREDDMGIEGLRKAKLSYKPAIMLEKYFIRRNTK